MIDDGFGMLSRAKARGHSFHGAAHEGFPPWTAKA